MGVQGATPSRETTRIFVRYQDHDGISFIADRVALLARYRDHSLSTVSDEEIFKRSVAANPTRTLVALANAREALSWGTHQSPGECVAILSFAPFAADELEANGVRSTLDVGCIAVRGELFVGGWHSFTYGADYSNGELPCPRLSVPVGAYRVTVHRPFSAERPSTGTGATFLVHLERVDPSEAIDAHAALVEVPGGDGYLF